MAVRAKLRVESITEHAWNPNSKTVKLSAQYDTSIPEDQRFCRATPSATFEMQVDNPAALEQLKLGEYYYVDFTPAAKPGT